MRAQEAKLMSPTRKTAAGNISRSTGKFEDRTCEVCGIIGSYPAIKRHQIARHKNDWRVFPTHAEDNNTVRIRGFFLPVVLNEAVESLITGQEPQTEAEMKAAAKEARRLAKLAKAQATEKAAANPAA